MSEDFDFDKFNEEFNEVGIALDEVAKAVVPLYAAFRKQGLPAQEAACLTAAMVNQTIPNVPQPPQED